MKKIIFTNKLWISGKGRTLDLVLHILCWIYGLLDLVVIIMEGLEFTQVISLVIVIVVLLYTKSQLKNSGYYITSECNMTFSTNKLLWEYPDVNMSNIHGRASMTYEIISADIKNVTISNEINSLRLECSPVLTYDYGNKTKVYDHRKDRKSIVLITYNYDINELKQLFEDYLYVQVDVID